MKFKITYIEKSNQPGEPVWKTCEVICENWIELGLRAHELENDTSVQNTIVRIIAL